MEGFHGLSVTFHVTHTRPIIQPAHFSWTSLPCKRTFIYDLLTNAFFNKQNRGPPGLLWAGTPIFLGNLSKSLSGTATFSGIAFLDSYFEMRSLKMIKMADEIVSWPNISQKMWPYRAGTRDRLVRSQRRY